MDSVNRNTLLGNPAVLRRINRVRLLNHLRVARGGSRVQIARLTGLDPKTVTNLTNGLLQDGLVVSTRASAQGRGRPADNLSLNADAALALGVDIGAQQVSAVLMDLSGAVRAGWHQDFGHARTGRFLIGKAREALESLLAPLSSRQKKKIQGMGVCVPGFLHREQGVVVNSVNIRGFRDFSILDAFGDLGVPVVLEESSRSMALAEKWFGAYGSSRNFICMDLGYGIGMGFVHHGLLYRGTNEVSGEIGHTVVDTAGPVCHCGKTGCLEAVASGKALAQVAGNLNLDTRRLRATGAAALHKAAVQGHARAREALQQAGRSIGIAVANMINLFDPGRVVLNGGLLRAGELLVDGLLETVDQYRLQGAPHACDIEVSTLGELAGAMGAAMLPLRVYFEFDNIQL